jgi:hypothetical protein
VAAMDASVRIMDAIVVFSTIVPAKISVWTGTGEQSCMNLIQGREEEDMCVALIWRSECYCASSWN